MITINTIPIKRFKEVLKYENDSRAMTAAMLGYSPEQLENLSGKEFAAQMLQINLNEAASFTDLPKELNGKPMPEDVLDSINAEQFLSISAILEDEAPNELLALIEIAEIYFGDLSEAQTSHVISAGFFLTKKFQKQLNGIIADLKPYKTPKWKRLVLAIYKMILGIFKIYGRSRKKI